MRQANVFKPIPSCAFGGKMKLLMNGYPVDGWPGQKELRDLGDADKSLTNPAAWPGSR